MTQQLRICTDLAEDPIQLTVSMSEGWYPPADLAPGAPKPLSGPCRCPHTSHVICVHKQVVK